MKHRFIAAFFWAFFTWVLTPQAFSQDPNFHIYLCFGQSNMEGQGPIEAQDQTVDSRFRVMQAVSCTGQPQNAWRTATPPIARCNTKIGPSDYFGREMVKNLPANIKVGIVHVSVAGCKIELFDKTNYNTYLNSLSSADQYIKTTAGQYGGNPYGRLVELAKLAQKDGVIKGILLHQGESNTGDQAWATKVNNVYKNLLADLGLTAANVPLLAGQVVDAAQGGLCASMNTTINALPNTIPTAHVISSSGCTDQSDNLHFTTAGYRLLGTRYAQTMLSLLNITAAAAPVVTLTAPTATSFTAPASITITATATDADGTISAVKFYNGSTLLSTVTTSPYTYSWTNVGAGTYSITAVATDNSGSSTTSTAKSVTVTTTTSTTNPIGKCKGKYFGNIIANSVPSTYTTYWNQVTSENSSKWGSVENTQGTYNWTGSDLAYNWAKNNGGLFKYHAFVWGQQAPGWVSTASAATITAAVQNYIKACSTHYAPMGGLKMIDVLNEPVNTAMPGNMKAALTAGYKAEPANANDLNNPYGWVIWPFQLARKYFPDAVLLINEYNVEMNWNNCRAPYLEMANAVKNAPNLTDGKKNLIDGVGLQCHGIDNLTAANFKACIDEIWTKTGLPTHITEFDQQADPNEAKQTSVYSSLIPVAWEHPHVAGITLWGYIQGTTWRNGNGTSGANGTDSGIMYANGTPRPALTWLINYMAGKPSLSCCPAPFPFADCSSGSSPVVSLTAPVNNATYAAGATVTLTAAATDADGTISNVEFYSGTTLLGSKTTAPYSYSWATVAEGVYTITAVATDNSGNKTTSTAITITVGNPKKELINNGEFDSGTTGWTLQNNNNATGTMSVVTNGNLSGTNSLRVCPSSNPGTIEWHVQVSQTTPVVAGKTYQISFMAKADAARQMSVNLQELASPYTTYFSQTIDLTTAAQTFSFTYTADVTDATALMKFYAGANSICLNIDKVSMTEGNFVLTPVITPAGLTTFCTGGNVILNANTGTGYTYQWKKDAADITGATAAAYTATQSGSYTVTITANGQTATAPAVAVTVNALPAAPAVTTPVTYCVNATAVPVTAAGTALKWYDAATGGTVVTALTPSTSAAGTTNYYASQTVNGCESSRATLVVIVNALPAAAITAAGATNICQGNSVILTASAGTSYIWKNGNTQVGTTASYTATAAGSYTVEVTNAGGCKAVSPVTTVAVTSIPAATITATGSTTFCQGGSVLLTASAGSSYIWKNGNTQVGTAASYTATTAGSYTVEVTGSGNCKGTSGTTTVTVTIPTIWFADTDNDGLGDAENTRAACEKPAGYVSTAGDLCPADPAKTVPGTCGCGLPETDCISTDIDFSSVQQDFMLFPNPVTLQTLYFSESISGTVYDSKGSLVFSFTELESIDTGILENGLYLIYTKTGDTYKFLVSR
ncbi:endo-1,4-beta-xylanase [Cytophaga hutchinsonii]|uniref:endo-1,4-beta-xylanase n=1 Tax=Cytophaga hutchinsonii (strain ATCC 33406 / DSM 1761 / CIP 103989 / NBRC 15051 / NCIMB 9469 / D465) TaxID=269798 RepID=A0A6N4SQG8_CYTH3|nr:endo-1,4-beta-xylanase [Cytophaga hutchinsonii]ABG58511.1 CHU large protein; candidate bifunctional acetylxylan esterase/xylanase, CBM4 module, Glycoside Hydrolase Family 10 protein and Carbohydrate Esterase Family 6 protein [Cytophaga hutchinsonii ATCC 33406]SFX75993.1 Endo-1,4-beta-xylanase, GH35 family [Cytophaga hutchinsonii ATCC 33406]